MVRLHSGALCAASLCRFGRVRKTRSGVAGITSERPHRGGILRFSSRPLHIHLSLITLRGMPSMSVVVDLMLSMVGESVERCGEF